MKQLFITIDQLMPLVKNSQGQCLVVDARSKKEFLRGHIPGAIHIPWEMWNEAPPTDVRQILRIPGYWGKLADSEKEEFGKKLSELGVNNDQPVVVYANGKISKGREGRIAWMLLYLGVKNVSILDGGIKAWKSRHLPLEYEVNKQKASSFKVELQPQRRILHEDLVNKVGTDAFPTMIDSRSEDEYTGKIFWYQPNKGRLPGSHLLVYNEIFKPDGNHFISEEAYKRLLPEGYDEQTNIGTYCEVGVRTCTVALLHEHYTGQILPVYDGSIMEWTFDKRLPVFQT